MEHAFAVMLMAELTRASPNKLSALTQSAVKLRPAVVARILQNHVRQSPIEVLPPAMQFAEGLCRNAGSAFKTTFESELPALFEQAWKRSNRSICNQLLKLYVSWKSTLPQGVITNIDARMKTAKATKREPDPPILKTPMKRMKMNTFEPMNGGPIPMRSNNPPYWTVDPDPNMIQIESEEDSDQEQEPKMNVTYLVEKFMKAAEVCKARSKEQPQTSLSSTSFQNLNAQHLHAYDESVYLKLVEGTKATKPRYLDWRFHLRRERKKQNCQSRAWYAHPEVWAQESNPKDSSPQQLLQRLSKPRSFKSEDIMRVPIDDAHPQPRCAISGDLFEKDFDEKTGKWYYINCRKLYREEAEANGVSNGSICLTECIKPSHRF